MFETRDYRNKTVATHVSPEELVILKETAALKHVSMSDLLREALAIYFDGLKPPQEKKPEEPKPKRHLHLMGR